MSFPKMNPSTKTLRWAALAALTIANTAAQAASLFTFTDEASFLSALTADSFTENFLPQNTGSPTSLTFTGGAPSISYTISAQGGLYNQAIGNFGGNLSVSFDGVPLVVNGFSRPINAIGAYLFASNSNYSPKNSPLTISYTDGAGIHTSSFASTPLTGPAGFFGVISDTTITTFSFSATASGAFPNIGTLTVGYAAVAVPEPAEYAAVTGLALGVFALVQRRRQAAGR